MKFKAYGRLPLIIALLLTILSSCNDKDKKDFAPAPPIVPIISPDTITITADTVFVRRTYDLYSLKSLDVFGLASNGQYCEFTLTATDSTYATAITYASDTDFMTSQSVRIIPWPSDFCFNHPNNLTITTQMLIDDPDHRNDSAKYMTLNINSNTLMCLILNIQEDPTPYINDLNYLRVQMGTLLYPYKYEPESPLVYTVPELKFGQ